VASTPGSSMTLEHCNKTSPKPVVPYTTTAPPEFVSRNAPQLPLLDAKSAAASPTTNRSPRQFLHAYADEEPQHQERSFPTTPILHCSAYSSWNSATTPPTVLDTASSPRSEQSTYNPFTGATTAFYLSLSTPTTDGDSTATSEEQTTKIVLLDQLLTIPNRLEETIEMVSPEPFSSRDAEHTMRLQSKTLSADSMRRALSLLHSGLAQLEARKYNTALQSFGTAASIFRLSQKKPVALARALDLSGVAYSRISQWQLALNCLHDALALRQQELGLWHVDTVDTVKNMGNVYMRSGNARLARRCYWQVFQGRKAIFGMTHPSVAVSAHDLANAFRAEGRFAKAHKYYRISMELYEKMALPRSNPAIKNLIRDIKVLETSSKGSSQNTSPTEDRVFPTGGSNSSSLVPASKL
jgi:hypothetical protein